MRKTLRLFIALLLCSSFGAMAQKQMTKVSPDLAKAARQVGQNARMAQPQGLGPVAERYQVRNNKILVEAIAEGAAAELAAELQGIGGDEISIRGNLVNAYVPVGSVSNLADLKSLKYARPALKPVANAGLVTSEGDVAQQSDDVRNIFGLDGSGVKVGVLSDSYDYLEGAAGNVASGDLPGPGNPNGYAQPVEVLLDDAGIDEGRAMMEIIHDVAPGAELAFHTAFLGRASFAEGILALADAGCDVIVDDITYLNEPYFQDGPIAQAVDEATAGGAAYFSSAGNRLRSSYESEFRPGDPTYLMDFFTGDTIGLYALHDFDPGTGVDNFQQVTIPANGTIELALQWSDPYASACEWCPGAESDLDMFLALVDNDHSSMYFDLSAFDYNLGVDPFEFLGVAVGDEDATVYIVIGKYLGFGPSPDPAVIKYVDYGSEPQPEYATFSSTIVGHHNAKGSNTVGAVRYDRTPAYGVATPPQEIFSSVGGLQILFDTNGNPIEPEDRQKPDFSAVQGGNSTFFGFDYEGDGLPNFFGTSASAPHAAAVAALMKEFDPSLTPQQINQIMEENAIDMDDPFTPGFDTGFDYGTGHGFLSAAKVVAALDDEPTVSSFNFVNSTSEQFLRTVWGAIDIATVENGKINITADVETPHDSWKPKSVVFKLKGPNWFYNRENEPPYALFGDRKNNLNNWQPRAGSYELTATPYSERNGRGKKGNSLTKQFEVTFGGSITDPFVFSIIDPKTGDEITLLQDGDTVDLSVIPRINIKAEPQMENVESVFFDLEGPYRKFQIENLEPYTLFSHFYGWWPFGLLPEGTYRLKTTPFSYYFARGDKGPSQELTFTVVNSGLDAARYGLTADSEKQTEIEGMDLDYTLNAYPNPTNDEIILEGLGARMDEKLNVNIYDSRGRILLNRQFAGVIYERMSLKQYGTGMFIIKMSGNNFVQYKKVIVN